MNYGNLQSALNHSRRSRLGTIAAVAFGILASGQTLAAEPARTGAANPSVVASADIVKFVPGMNIGALANRRDSDLVEFSDGKRMRVGELRRLDTWGRNARSTPGKQFPEALRAKPATTGRRIENVGDLAAALERPDSETVQLPSGRFATVGQIKFVLPEVEKRLGHSVSAAAKRPNLSGPAIKINDRTDWKSILQRTDGTVLEAPDGTRITVGELKQTFQKTKTARTDSSAETVPKRPAQSSAPKQR